MANNNEISFEIKEHLGILDTSGNGWQLEANIINWNNSPIDKLDLRSWSPDHQRMTKGSTFTEEQAEKLFSLLSVRYGR